MSDLTIMLLVAFAMVLFDYRRGRKRRWTRPMLVALLFTMVAPGRRTRVVTPLGNTARAPAPEVVPTERT